MWTWLRGQQAKTAETLGGVKVRRRKGMRNMTLRINSKGEAIVSAPPRLSLSHIRVFIDKHSHWLETQRQARETTARLDEGATVLWQGERCTLRRTGKLRGQLYVSHETTPPTLWVPGDTAAVPRRLKQALMKQVQSDVPVMLDILIHRGAKKPLRVAFKDTRSRWGSCSSRGTINLSWRLGMAPPEVLFYVLAHELAHLDVFDHSPAFWDRLKTLDPAMNSAKAWLKAHGPEIMRYPLSSV